MIRFETTHGGFTVELFQEDAPLTVANFLRTSTTGSSTAPYSTAWYRVS